MAICALAIPVLEIAGPVKRVIVFCNFTGLYFNPALSTITDAPNACTGCHTDESDSWAAAQVDKWRGNKEPPKKDFASWQIAAAQIQASGSQQQWQQLEQQRHDLLSLASTPQMKRAMLLQAMPVLTSNRSMHWRVDYPMMMWWFDWLP